MLSDGVEHGQVDDALCCEFVADAFELCLCIVGEDELSGAITYEVRAFDKPCELVGCGSRCRSKAVDAELAD